MVDKRFLHELPAIIANATQGEDRELRETAYHIIIRYIKEMASNSDTPNADVAHYFISALSDLSPSEIERLANRLSVPINEDTLPRLLDSLHMLSNAATERLVERLTATEGRNKIRLVNEIDDIKFGLEVSKLHTEYKLNTNPEYEETKQLGLEPKERAISEIAEKHKESKAKIRRMYSLFRYFLDMGSIDEDGNFIIREYDFILPDQKKK